MSDMSEINDEKAAEISSEQSALSSAVSASTAKDQSEMSSDERQIHWYKNVYQGDDVPQFTWRAVLMGGLLGSLMSVSNLYTAIKVGWLFGVAITACVLSFTIWRTIRLVFPKLTDMTILENNCMQSTASSAGYSTGSTIATAFGAYLLITGHQIPFHITAVWTFITALLGVLLAVPMKKQMINKEQLPFPSGIAAAQTLKSLYGGSKDALKQAYSLVTAMAIGVGVGVAGKGDFGWQKAIGFKLPEILPFNMTIRNVNLADFPAFGFEPSLLIMSAGMIIGLRVCVSMLLGASILYFYVGPWVMENHILENPHQLISKWALWTGTSIMVSSGLTAFAMQWKTIVRAMSSIKPIDENSKILAEMDRIEVPTKWFVIGVVPLAIIFSIIMYLAFNVNPILGLMAVVLSFFLALVACRATGETDVTPIGAMGKISQLMFAVFSPHNITSNLMAASVTANCASASADLLTDLKSGYLLGANARKQFLAQLCGVFFGTITIVPAWFLMIPNKAALEAFNPPMTILYKAVAEALSNGIGGLPETARMGIVVGAIIGLVMTVIETVYPKTKKFMPSPMGLGLSWIFPYQNSLGFCIGAIIAFIWKKINPKNAEGYTVPVASGAIAGESIACAFIAIFNAVKALLHI